MPTTIQMPKRSQVSPGRLSIRYRQASTERTGRTGTPGTRNDRGRSGRVRRSTSTPTATSTNANSVPMLTSSASSLSGTNVEMTATARPVTTVVRTGVPVLLLTVENTGGSSRSRLIAKNTRLCPSIRIIITVVSPSSAPAEMMVAKAGWPTERNASASGASTLMSVYLTIPVTTSDTATYRTVQMVSEARMPIGMSRCGFLVSSAAVATMSKPMNAKNTSAAPVKIPVTPNEPGANPRSCSRDGELTAPAAVGEPAGGMNGE